MQSSQVSLSIARLALVKIDTPELWKTYLQGTSGNTGYGAGPRGFNRDRNNRTFTDKQVQDLLGQPLPKGKVALALPIQLAVTDEEAQEDRISVFAIVLGDKSAVDKITAEKQSAMEEANAKRQAQRQAQREAEVARMKDFQKQRESGGGMDSKRLDDLERRLKRIEASVGSILLKLEGMNR